MKAALNRLIDSDMVSTRLIETTVEDETGKPNTESN